MATGLFTPDAIKAEMRSLDTELSIMANDLMSAPNVPTNITEGFNKFIEEWESFVKDNSSWFARGLNITNERVSEFKRRASYWTEIFRRSGIKTISTIKAFEKEAGSSFVIPWWAWLAGAGLVLWKLSPLRTAERIKTLAAPKSGKKK